ncbi:MAG: Fe-S cluster assembly protein SufD [Gemmatimonadetes bacterium]|nr:Fe-S cluster assembly protein SufD [Gemmatimonadota bacterium]
MWLRERRLRAWDVYAALPVPDTRSEAWRYTDLSRIPWTDAETTSGPPPPPEPTALDPRLASAGVVFTDIATAVRRHETLLEPHLLRAAVEPGLGKFAALHAALLDGGTFLYVPPDVEVELPLRTLRTMPRDGAAAFPHTLIVADRNSRVTYVEESSSPTLPRLAVNCAAIEILARAGATVRIVTVQEWGRHVFHYGLQRARVERDATVRSLVVTLGGRLARAEIQSLLEAEGGTSEMLGLYLADADQHVDHHTLQLHQAPHTNSDLLFKGALWGRARSAFSGLIKVSKGAQRTDAYQKNRNLLLSAEARADSLPNLEIEADDVRCSHGATIGRADELQIFYLMSRGLTREAAERMLVLGFFEEVLARLPLEDLRERLRSSIRRKASIP